MECLWYTRKRREGSRKHSVFQQERHLLVKRRSLKCPIVALHRECRILQFKVATRCKIIKYLLHNGAIVLEASHNRTCVDVVKGFTEHPILLRIIDFEAAVCWDAR